MKFYIAVISIKPNDHRMLFLKEDSIVLKSSKLTWKAEINEIDYLTGIKNLGTNTNVTIHDGVA